LFEVDFRILSVRFIGVWGFLNGVDSIAAGIVAEGLSTAFIPKVAWFSTSKADSLVGLVWVITSSRSLLARLGCGLLMLVLVILLLSGVQLVSGIGSPIGLSESLDGVVLSKELLLEIHNMGF
jgi:hypothetical protein